MQQAVALLRCPLKSSSYEVISRMLYIFKNRDRFCTVTYRPLKQAVTSHGSSAGRCKKLAL